MHLSDGLLFGRKSAFTSMFENVVELDVGVADFKE